MFALSCRKNSCAFNDPPVLGLDIGTHFHNYTIVDIIFITLALGDTFAHKIIPARGTYIIPPDTHLIYIGINFTGACNDLHNQYKRQE